MAERQTIQVTTVIDGQDVVAGHIHPTRASASFTYAEDYLTRGDAFALAPALGLFPGAQPLAPVNPFSDSAPDSWGRRVLHRAAGRRLDELSLLLGVNDEGRQGATRFWTDGIARADGSGIPPERDLSEILRIADAVETGATEIPDVDARRLFRATGSLGGARPKANVRIGSQLWLAKFPKPHGDPWNVMAWEAAVLDLMAAAGVDAPAHQVRHVTVDGSARTVLLLRRFDRGPAGRIPYLSAMTALEATDGDGGDWLDLAEWASENGADTRELWRRAVLGVLVGNVDDHLRNHGFLRRGTAWALAPAFDVNPTPLDEGDEHQLSLFGQSRPQLDSLLASDALELFRVPEPQAVTWVRSLAAPLDRTLAAAARHGADRRSVDVMRDRFTHALGQVDAV